MRVVIFVILFVIAISTCGQNNETRNISGIVCDMSTSDLLPEAIMRCNGKLYTPDYAGRISGSFANGDVLTFSHVGYHSAKLIVNDSISKQALFAIFLSRDTILLPEIIVHPRLEILNELRTCNHLEVSINNLIVKQNFERCRQLAFTAPSEWDAEDNQRNMIQQNVTNLEYKGMIAPNQMVSIGNVAISAFIALIRQKKEQKKDYSQQQNLQKVRPLTMSEMQNLINENKNKRWSILIQK